MVRHRLRGVAPDGAARKIALIGAPADMGAGNRGCAAGPAALRAAGLAQALRRQGYEVADRGDLGGSGHAALLGNTGGRTVGGCRHLREIAAWCRAIRDEVADALAADALPVLLGGDHSLAIGSVAAIARHCTAMRKPLSMLWLDAHADFNTARTTPSGNVHGMPVAVIAGDGHWALTRLGHARPMLPARDIVQLGVRSIDPLEQRRIDAHRLRVHGMDDIRARGLRAVVAELLAGMARSGSHLHVSFDVDFLDPAVAPGVGTPERDGPSLDEAMLCMEMIRESGLLGSLDIVELNPATDPLGQTSERVVALVERLFAGSAVRRLGLAA